MKYVGQAAIHWITFTAKWPLCSHTALKKGHFCTALHSTAAYIQNCTFHQCAHSNPLVKQVAAQCAFLQCAAVWRVIQCLALLPGGARVLGKKRQLLPRFRIPPLLLDLVEVHQMIPKRITTLVAATDYSDGLDLAAPR